MDQQVGQFGEGLKIAIFTFLRQNKTVKIQNCSDTGSMTEWEFQKINKFDAECVEYRETTKENIESNNRTKCVVISVGGIDANAWADFTYDKFLLLTDVTKKIHTNSSGDLLLGN